MGEYTGSFAGVVSVERRLRMGGNPGSREPSQSALSPPDGFDPGRNVLSKLEGYTPPETPQDWACVEAAQTIMVLRAALEPFAKCAEQLKNRTDFGDKAIVSVGQTVLTLDDFNQARKAFGGTK